MGFTGGKVVTLDGLPASHQSMVDRVVEVSRQTFLELRLRFDQSSLEGVCAMELWASIHCTYSSYACSGSEWWVSILHIMRWGGGGGKHRRGGPESFRHNSSDPRVSNGGCVGTGWWGVEIERERRHTL